MLRTIRFALLASLSVVAPMFAAGSAAGVELKGKFVYDGAAPEKTPVLDPKVEGDFPGQKLFYENLVVDPTTKGIANIAIWVKTPDVAITPEAEKALEGNDKIVVDNKSGQFQPHLTTLWSGKQKLIFKNSDPVGHNSNFPFANANPLLPPNSEQEIAVAGGKNLPQELSCNIHPWMKAYIVAHENPYVAITGADGSFSLKNLPAGTELEFQVWHEKAGYLPAVADWGKQAKFTLTLSEDKDLGEIKVSPELFNK
jgi:hypothetical protein